MVVQADKKRFETTGPRAVLLSDRRDGADLWGVAEAVRPLAELCLSTEAETPFTLGLVGARGVGKSFALRRLVERIEAGDGGPGLVSKAVVACVDASCAHPASAVAAAVYARLEEDYAALAEEAAHATVEPRHAAAVAADRHDEIVGRLEQERHARDEVEARRARLSGSLLRETPGSHVDAFIRASRGAIGTRLRGFGFDGEVDANFRSLVNDLGGGQGASGIALFLRATWAYRGQTRLIVLALLAFALAYAIGWARAPLAGDGLASINAEVAPAMDWVKAHADGLGLAGQALIAAGVVALAVNIWRAARFTRLLFQGQRMLNLDVAERRRELDASAARLERRVSALQLEADAAGQRAETLARRAGGASAPSRPKGPDFLGPADAPERAARAFLDDLGRAMNASVTPAPQRIVVAIDGLDALNGAEARRFVQTAARIAGRGVALIAAVDLARLGDAREGAESLFDVVYDVAAPPAASVTPWLAAPSMAAPAKSPSLSEPLDETEAGFLKSASALIGPRPRALKRFYNAYRLARLADAPRGVVALSLAALMAPDPAAASALRASLSGEGELAAPAAPPALAAVFAGPCAQGVGKTDARRAFEAARRFAPWASSLAAPGAEALDRGAAFRAS